MSEFHFLHWNYIYLLFGVVLFIIPILLKRKQLPVISFYSLIFFKLIIFLMLVISLMTPSTTKLSSQKKLHYIFGFDISLSINRKSLKEELEKYLKEYEKIDTDSIKTSYFYLENSPKLLSLSDFNIDDLETKKSNKYSSIYESIYEIKDEIDIDSIPVFIIFSDGNETEVHDNVLQTLALDKVHFKLVKSISRDDNVKIEGVSHPHEILPKSNSKIEVYVNSKKVGKADLNLYRNAALIEKKVVDLKVGANLIEFKLFASNSGIDSYSLELIPAFEDTKKSNNYKFFHIKIEKPNKYLLIENSRSNLQTLLKELKIEFDWIKPKTLYKASPHLYQAVIINNVKKEDIPDAFESKLANFVADGGGFALFGGLNSYGLGKYYGSDIEKISPVYMPPRSYNKKALVYFIIDVSGSMLSSRKSLWGSNQLLAQFLQTAPDTQVPIRVAKKAAANALEKLKGVDVSIYSFSTSYKLVVPIISLTDSNIDSVKRSILSIQAGGGTQYGPVLNEALSSVNTNNYKQAYFFFLSDGAPKDRQAIPPILEKLKQKKISLYTLGFGKGVDEGLMKWMASTTGGLYFKAGDVLNLSTIFEKAMDKVFNHAVILKNTSIEFNKKQTFFDSKKIKLSSLNGLNMTRAKEGAKVLLNSESGFPILVQSQYGLGKTFAWMGDTGEKWTQSLIRSGAFKELIAPNLFLISKSNEIHFQFNYSHQGKESFFVARVFDEKGIFLQNLDLTAKLISSNSKKSKYINFFESEEGVYKASALIEDDENFQILLDYTYKNKTYKLTRKIKIPTNFETAFDGENKSLESNFRNKGKLIYDKKSFIKIFKTYKGEKKYFVIKYSIPFLLLAIFLYILDVIFRRFRIMDQLNKEGNTEDKWANLANHYLILARNQMKEGEQSKAEHSYLSAKKYFKMSNLDKKSEEVWKEYRRNVT
ncbi:MAG: hypothetical protein COB02_17625 [Candidatus Cloacimonadota bacterium]|nr:MAG: hypothetical protein COB02_17625 [Candidatus Cloacimonadota bacterium]